MFREMRRNAQEVSSEECKEILANEKRCVISLIGEDGYPYSLPMNYYYDRDKNIIYFHGAKEGYKIDLLKKNNKVCFTTWNKGFKKENDWSWNVTSVVIFGHATLLDNDDASIEVLRKLGNKYYPTEEEVDDVISRYKDKVQMIKIEIDHMTGKLVNES